MGVKYPFPPDFKTIYEKADLLKVGREDSTVSDIQIERNKILTKKLRAFYFYTYLSGTRISEALDLKYTDIQFNTVQNVNLCFATVYTRKNRIKMIRTIPISYMNEYEQKMFAEFADVYNHSIDYVFKDLIVEDERNRMGYDKNLREIHYIKKDGSDSTKEFKDPYASTKTKTSSSTLKFLYILTFPILLPIPPEVYSCQNDKPADVFHSECEQAQ